MVFLSFKILNCAPCPGLDRDLSRQKPNYITASLLYILIVVAIHIQGLVMYNKALGVPVLNLSV